MHCAIFCTNIFDNDAGIAFLQNMVSMNRIKPPLATSADIDLLRTIAKKPELCLCCSCTMQAFFHQHFFLLITKGIDDYTYETENENQRRIWLPTEENVPHIYPSICNIHNTNIALNVFTPRLLWL
uniref:Uncharacterized protein n=1 Tax=Glossina pallidipes TaxID=7398 RepID=A0A1B0A3H0_GLOPL